MASGPNTALATILSALIVLLLPPILKADDTCPYPCYPPPTGGGTPATPSPPSQTGSGSYSPPAYYSPPAGYYPYNPPPYGYGNGNNFDGISPPPPDPVMPYFPYYYKRPPHQTDDQSGSAITGPKSEITIAIATVFIYLSLSFSMM